MAYIDLCREKSLYEGEVASFSVNGREVLVVWPDGGEPHAYDGMCPHQRNVPLVRGNFNGRLLTCPAHEWVFDGRTGEGLRPTGCRLREFALRLENGSYQIELA
jgi:toluene monooxygenase system ferredoxin subunit